MLNISPEESTIIFRVFIALILGLALGVQREKRKIVENNLGVAGLRTHSIVMIGAALVSAVGYITVPQDPLRLAASILTGIGFIGAGTIIADKDKIIGLVKATTIWLAAVIGIAIGIGHYNVAVFTTIITILILELKRFEIKE